VADGGERTEGEDDSGGTGGERRKRDANGNGREDTERERERGLYNPRAYSISTEINQGCAQISKREITKINRPDVRRDKKRDSLASLFSFFFLQPPLHRRADRDKRGYPPRHSRRVRGRARSRIYINYTDRAHKIPRRQARDVVNCNALISPNELAARRSQSPQQLAIKRLCPGQLVHVWLWRDSRHSAKTRGQTRRD